MSKFRYFAYGSNMLTEWLRSRCETAEFVGIAKVVGFSVQFDKRSKLDGSGKATLVRSNCDAFGVVFEIENSDLPELDRHEGKGRGYYRDDCFRVSLAGRHTIYTKAYLAEEPEANLRPYDWYIALVIAGAREHNLDQDYVAQFREIAYDVDHNANRPTRKNAIEALTRSGFPDHRTILLDG